MSKEYIHIGNTRQIIKGKYIAKLKLSLLVRLYQLCYYYTVHGMVLGIHGTWYIHMILNQAQAQPKYNTTDTTLFLELTTRPKKKSSIRNSLFRRRLPDSLIRSLP